MQNSLRPELVVSDSRQLNEMVLEVAKSATADQIIYIHSGHSLVKRLKLKQAFDVQIIDVNGIRC